MSNPIHPRRVARMCAASALAAGLVFAAAPIAAQAAAVNLGTATPFVVLGGQSVTNTGPSVLNGSLGVSPGTSLVGFGLPAVVNGPTHNNDAVASGAQADLTTAYNVAAGEPPAAVLTGQDLGGMTLVAGAYAFSSSAGLTGALTLDAQGNPNAQFVFQIGSTLTTASASSVVLINGASPCNVYWQVGSSATLGSTTAFQGNVMALSDISLNNGATVVGRMLARNGSVTLINNVLNAGGCGANTTATPGTGTGRGTGGDGDGADDAAATTRNGTARLRRIPSEAAPPAGVCTAGFHARVRGAMIERVVFTMDGWRIGTRTRGPYTVNVRAAAAGRHLIRARVTFRDATRARTLTMRYRACAAL
ncbi:MAG: hypothetical protein QOG77_1712, partial [Solirubrobacteraceae bacterium]|nr:hypothetical protein [Solirubrobacteraceae bacterium]